MFCLMGTNVSVKHDQSCNSNHVDRSHNILECLNKSYYTFSNSCIKRIITRDICHTYYVLALNVFMNRPNKKTCFCKLKFTGMNKDLILKKHDFSGF